MTMRTYYKINGEVSEYPVKKYSAQQAKKRPKCDKLSLIHI